MRADLDVAATLECEPELLPHLPEILQDFDSLGSDPQRLIESLESAEAAGTIQRALDLCCGKGAASIALAKHFGFRVTGIDAIEAFIDSARAAADREGVADLCRFTTGDLCAAVARPGNYDLVIFGAVGPILGGITRTAGHLMTPLRGGGWILMDDSVLLAGAPTRPGFESHADLAETRRRIELSGAEIVGMSATECAANELGQDTERIVRRAAALARRRPHLCSLIERYVERQKHECAFLERWTRDVTWLLRKPA